LKRVIVIALVGLMSHCGGTAYYKSHGAQSFDITFFGDSLLRYQYLNFVYAIHFNTAVPPEYLVNEKLFTSWVDFYNATTTIFGDNMLCDCFRSESKSFTHDYLLSIRENRYYTSRDGRLTVRYYQRFGDARSIGMKGENIAKWYSKNDGIQYDWTYESQEDMLRNEVVHSNLLIMSSPHHPKTKMDKRLNEIITTAIEISDDVVWQQMPIHRQDAVEDSGTYSWMDDMIQKVQLCHPPLPVQTSERHQCWFETFPLLPAALKHDDYFDNLHFRNNTIYSIWTKRALQITRNCRKAGQFCFM
jgi:hypothetical protein